MAWFIFFSVNFIAGTLGLLNVKQKKLLLLIVILNILFFLGLRYKVGVDWGVYQDLYEGRSINVPFEYGYELVSKLFSLTWVSFWFYVFSITFYMTITLYCFFKKFSPAPVFCIAFYFILSFSFNVDALRQIMAVATCLWGLMFYIDNKKNSFAISILIAATFHISALIFILIPLINHRLFRNYAVTLIALGLGLSVFGQYPVDWIIKILSAFTSNPYIYKIKIYTLGTNVSSVLTFNLVFKIIMLSLFVVNKNKIENSIQNNVSIYGFRLFTSIFYFIFIVDIYLGKYGPIRLRLDEYFAPVFVLMISYIILASRKILTKQIIAVFFILYSAITIAKFSQNEYFIKQFGYSNSIMQAIIQDRTYDKKREVSIQEHWAERDKIVVDEN